MKPTFKEKQATLFGRLKDLKSRPTKYELRIKELLEQLGIKFIFQKGFINGDYYCIVDFYLPKPYKICIEVDGEYHFTDDMRKRDARKDSYLRSRNFNVMRIRNEFANTIEPSQLLELINAKAAQKDR